MTSRKLCWFCDKFAPSDEAAVTVMMYGNVIREQGRVSWSNLVVTVPRCVNCQRTHRNVTRISISVWLACLAACLPLALFANDWWFSSVITGHVLIIPRGAKLVLVLLPIVIVALVLGYLCSSLSKKLFSKGVRDIDSVDKFSEIALRKREGWALGSRPGSSASDPVAESAHKGRVKSAYELAQDVIRTNYVDDAKALINALAGNISYETQGRIFRESKIVVGVLGQVQTFRTDFDMTCWVVQELAPRIISRSSDGA